MVDDAAVVAFIKEYGMACGGNWSAMLMSAIQHGLPEVFEAMEDRSYSFNELFATIKANLS